jgi:hypothetical protein
MLECEIDIPWPLALGAGGFFVLSLVGVFYRRWRER